MYNTNIHNCKIIHLYLLNLDINILLTEQLHNKQGKPIILRCKLN